MAACGRRISIIVWFMHSLCYCMFPPSYMCDLAPSSLQISRKPLRWLSPPSTIFWKMADSDVKCTQFVVNGLKHVNHEYGPLSCISIKKWYPCHLHKYGWDEECDVCVKATADEPYCTYGNLSPLLPSHPSSYLSAGWQVVVDSEGNFGLLPSD